MAPYLLWFWTTPEMGIFWSTSKVGTHEKYHLNLLAKLYRKILEEQPKLTKKIILLHQNHKQRHKFRATFHCVLQESGNFSSYPRKYRYHKVYERKGCEREYYYLQHIHIVVRNTCIKQFGQEIKWRWAKKNEEEVM